MTHEILITGFGGQGVLSMGNFLAQAGLIDEKEVSWLPSYGPEMRGGTAFCSVIISDEPVCSPVVTEPSCLMALNAPSLEKFINSVQSGGLVFVNSSLINTKVERADVQTYYIPCSELARQLGNSKVGNTIMLGAFLTLTGAISHQKIMQSMKEVLQNKPDLLQINIEAYEKGAEFVKPIPHSVNSIVKSLTNL